MKRTTCKVSWGGGGGRSIRTVVGYEYVGPPGVDHKWYVHRNLRNPRAWTVTDTITGRAIVSWASTRRLAIQALIEVIQRRGWEQVMGVIAEIAFGDDDGPSAVI